jgi:hypothetical protein
MENIELFNSGKKQLSSTKGTGNEIGSGHGLLVCREMLEKNDGELSLTIEDEGVLAMVFVKKML